MEALRRNPYLLVDREFEVEFSQADALALSLGVGAEDPLRLEAGLAFCVLQSLLKRQLSFWASKCLVIG